MRVYDVASIASKGVSEHHPARSRRSARHHIASSNATCVVLPTNQPINPLRNEGRNQTLDPSHDYGAVMRGENEEQVMHPIYRYAYITDAVEGLILTNSDTLQDQEPRNNFLTCALTWNEGGVLTGARYLTIAGTRFYVTADQGIVELDMEDPLHPRLVTVIPLQGARASFVQFRYLFVVGAGGLDVVVTRALAPGGAAAGPCSLCRCAHLRRAHLRLYRQRAGRLAIIDVERPEHPRVYLNYTAEGRLGDARRRCRGHQCLALRLCRRRGRGLKVIQLMSPESQPNFCGFAPEPKPQLIAWYPTASPALALSRGLERDRAVDETGHQIAVFGRIGRARST